MGFQLQICSILRFSWSILVKCCVHLQRSSSKTLRLLLEKNIFHKYWLFCYRFLTFTFYLCSLAFFLSVIRNNGKNNVTTPSSNQRLWPDSGQTLRHQYGISVADSQTFLLAKRPGGEEREETAVLAGYILYLSVRYKLVINEPLQGETCHPATVIRRTLGRYGTNIGQGSKIYLDVFNVSILHRHPTGISI